MSGDSISFNLNLNLNLSENPSMTPLATHTETSIIEVSHVATRFGKAVVHADVSLSVRRGEVFAIAGGNGCGKSTLLKLVAGLGSLKHDEGQVQMARGATVGYLSQDPDLDLDRTEPSLLDLPD